MLTTNIPEEYHANAKVQGLPVFFFQKSGKQFLKKTKRPSVEKLYAHNGELKGGG
jgi:preprotein translocase subunit Sss1